MTKLTAKREKYVQGLISGLSQRESYKQSYNCSSMKDTTIDVNAAKLIKDTKVLLRYNELLDEHKNKALWTREQSVNDLIWLKEQAKDDIQGIGVKQANSNAFLNAIKELNTLEDLYNSEDQEQYEDDGFMDALDGKEVIWDEED